MARYRSGHPQYEYLCRQLWGERAAAESCRRNSRTTGLLSFSTLRVMPTSAARWKSVSCRPRISAPPQINIRHLSPVLCTRDISTTTSGKPTAQVQCTPSPSRHGGQDTQRLCRRRHSPSTSNSRSLSCDLPHTCAANRRGIGYPEAAGG
jgi:hypothetical protein